MHLPHLSYRIGLSVDQVNWTLMHLNEKNGCPWSYRDSTTSDSCKIFGTIYLTWFNGSSLFYSHDNCRRCAASEEELVTYGDTGGLDYCNPTAHSLTLSRELRVSYQKM